MKFCNIEYSVCCDGKNQYCCDQNVVCCDTERRICCNRTSKPDFICCDMQDIVCENVLQESYGGKTQLEYTASYKYLGHMISIQNNNMAHINMMVERSQFIKCKIFNYLNKMQLGKYFFEVAIILFKCLLRPSILYSIETCYNLTEKEIRKIEQTEEDFLIKLAKTKQSCPLSQLYNEFGLYPARFEVIKLQILFLHKIYQEKSDSLLSKFIRKQREFPVKNDWFSQVKENMKFIRIYMTDEELKMCSKWKVKRLVNQQINVIALEYLLQKRKSKGKECVYNKIRMAEYLLPNSENITVKEKRQIFEIRNRMTNIPSNFKNQDSDCKCQFGCDEYETQAHVYECLKIHDEEGQGKTEYMNIFEGTVQQQYTVMQIFMRRLEKRNNYIHSE